MGSGTLANLGKLSLPETLTKNAQAMAPGIHRRVAQDSPKVGKAGCATGRYLHFEVRRQLVPLSDPSL
jgi:hypothetical protein